MTKKRIGIFGGSFNPPHIGHAGVCETVLKQKMADEVWVIPCYRHPFEKKLVPFEHRLKMCRLAFEDLGGRVQVLDLEKNMGGKSFTLRTVEYLKKKHPESEFLLILGEDAAKEAKTWYRYDDLRKALSWLVIPRGPQSMVPNVSATETREALQNKGSIETLIPKNVIEYIHDNHLYS
ncbi:MAG: nicotinate-nicotinamide nucleotide adenylyltransferase [Deltaproteobacteria bacterium]|nr:nicotinate-nicotinamide nucleotide adenylyltransferase [Deltaproteobacteria bacterium]